ncbi:MAG: hypothetical protein VR64_18560 [Desulfatitalea sp. BRH_c12]|nr:MAG: hypothetical protein VR64_18560 [Desulfatitalea sp. BRH_c12]
MDQSTTAQSFKTKFQGGGYFLPSIADIFFIAIFLTLCLQTNNQLLVDGDTAYHIRVGQHIIETHSIPKADIYSLHEPKPDWIAHEWLSEVIMAVAHRAYGINGVVVLYAFVITLSVYWLFKFLRCFSTNIIFISLVMLLTLAASQIHWLARPHVFSLLLTVIWYAILEFYQRDARNNLWCLPLLMLLWVNLHGGYQTGLILNITFLIGNVLHCTIFGDSQQVIHKKKALDISLITLMCLFATFINPNGYHILLFPFTLMQEKFIIDRISEFISPNFHSMMYVPFELTILFFFVILFLSTKKLETIDLGLVLVFLHLALFSRRYIPLFSLIVAPVLLKHMFSWRYLSENKIYRFINRKAAGLGEIDKSAKGFLWPALAMAVILIGISQNVISYKFDSSKKPLDAIHFINQEKIDGNMFNSDEFGDFLVFYAFPRYRVFIDGRLDMYGSELFEEYIDIVSFKPGWENLLAKYEITWIFYPSDSEFSRFLKINKEWVLIYSDEVASIFLKNIADNQALIHKYSKTQQVETAIPPDTAVSKHPNDGVPWT